MEYSLFHFDDNDVVVNQMYILLMDMETSFVLILSTEIIIEIKFARFIIYLPYIDLWFFVALIDD